MFKFLRDIRNYNNQGQCNIYLQIHAAKSCMYITSCFIYSKLLTILISNQWSLLKVVFVWKSILVVVLCKNISSQFNCHNFNFQVFWELWLDKVLINKRFSEKIKNHVHC